MLSVNEENWYWFNKAKPFIQEFPDLFDIKGLPEIERAVLAGICRAGQGFYNLLNKDIARRLVGRFTVDPFHNSHYLENAQMEILEHLTDPLSV